MSKISNNFYKKNIITFTNYFIYCHFKKNIKIIKKYFYHNYIVMVLDYQLLY